jgi:hypothetical protein
MTWIRNVFLVAMNHLKHMIRVTYSVSMRIPTLEDGILLCICLIVYRFSTDALLTFDTYIIKCISVVIGSNFILWGEFYYTLFWSPQ